MEELTLTTPSLLFSAVSLILLAYAQVVRNLKENYRKEPSKIALDQIKNLKKRLYLTRAMQVLGISSLLLCVVCTFLIYIGLQTAAVYTFAVALLLLVASLAVSIKEILISVHALEIHLNDME